MDSLTRNCVAVITLSDMDAVIAGLGHDTAQEIIHAMGLYIDKHFGAIGGFSTRNKANEFVTMFPYSDTAEAGNMKEFVDDLHKRRAMQLISGRKLKGARLWINVFDFVIRVAAPKAACCRNRIHYGIGRSLTKKIGRLQCAAKE